MNAKLIALFCGALLFPALASAVEEALTTPLGAVNISLPAGPSTSMIGIPIKAFAVARLPVASFTANTLTFAGTPFGSSVFSNASAPFFIRFLSGNHTGRALLVTANTGNSVTLDTTDGTSSTLALNTASFSVAVNDRIELVPGDTLASLFGDAVVSPIADKKLKTGLVGGTNALFADTVSFYNGVRFIAYYFNTTQNYWVSQEGGGNANDKLISPDTGLSVSRKGGAARASNLTLTFLGTVPNHRSGIRHPGAVSRIIVQPLPVPVPLSYFAFNAQGGLVKGSPLAADPVSIWNGVRWVPFYQNSGGQWLTSGMSGDQSNLSVSPGTAVSILRRVGKTDGASVLGSTSPF
jgi:hypothetical protein